MTQQPPVNGEIDLTELQEAMSFRCRENSGHPIYDIVWQAASAYLADQRAKEPQPIGYIDKNLDNG